MTHDKARQPASSSRRATRDSEFELAFGQRIRAARIVAGMSQGALGEAVGISYQQIQKYELGKDRLLVGTLQLLAGALGVGPGSFFSDEAIVSPARPVSLRELREAQRIGESIARLRDPVVIRRLVALADALVKAEDDGLVDPETED